MTLILITLLKNCQGDKLRNYEKKFQIEIVVKQSKFWSKILKLVKNCNFGQKLQFWSKIEIFVKNPKVWSKIQKLVKN